MGSSYDPLVSCLNQHRREIETIFYQVEFYRSKARASRFAKRLHFLKFELLPNATQTAIQIQFLSPFFSSTHKAHNRTRSIPVAVMVYERQRRRDRTVSKKSQKKGTCGKSPNNQKSSTSFACKAVTVTAPGPTIYLLLI